MNDHLKTNVLFICTHNAVRSQMAEAFLRHYADDDYAAFSAGVEPGEIDPRAIQVMEEVDIPLTGQTAKGLRTYLGQKHFGYVFTVCDYAESQCPTAWLQAQHHLHWDILDPKKAQGTEAEVLDKFRQSRDQVDAHVRAWLAGQTEPAV